MDGLDKEELPKVGYVEINKGIVMLPKSKLTEDEDGGVTTIRLAVKSVDTTAAFSAKESHKAAIKCC